MTLKRRFDGSMRRRAADDHINGRNTSVPSKSHQIVPRALSLSKSVLANADLAIDDHSVRIEVRGLNIDRSLEQSTFTTLLVKFCEHLAAGERVGALTIGGVGAREVAAGLSWWRRLCAIAETRELLSRTPRIRMVLRRSIEFT